jgi:hypothetical protein
MFDRFVSVIRHAGSASSFDSYFTGLHSKGINGLPKLEEAKRDYQALRSRLFRIVGY